MKGINVLLLIGLMSIWHVSVAQEKEGAAVQVKQVEDVALETTGSSRDDSYQVAWDLYKAGKYDEALKRINKLIDQDQTISAYYEVKCYILIGLKRNADIIATATTGIALDPENHTFYDIRGNTYYFDLKPELARSDYQRVLQLEKNNARYYNNYLKLLNEMRKDDELINVFTLFENNLKNGEEMAEPQFVADVYFYGALAFQRQKNNLRAIELLDKAIENSPKAAMYYNNRGLIFQDMDKLLQAKKDLDRAIELDINNPV